MFSKAKIKRFNEDVGCGPSPTAYDPVVKNSKSVAMSLDKSDRWRASREVTPGPGTYTGNLITSPTKQQLRSTSSSRLNSSTCSSTSTASGGAVFISPLKPLSRSRSVRTMRGRQDVDLRIAELEDQIRELTEERNKSRAIISQLEKQLQELQARISSGSASQASADGNVTHPEQKLKREKYEAELEAARFTLDDNEAQMESLNMSITVLTQQNEDLKSLLENGSRTEKDEPELQKQLDSTKMELVAAQQLISSLTDERSGLRLKLQQLEESAERKSLTEDELQSMREQLDHLMLLRDNLEGTTRAKDDLIAELQVQLDEVVVEGRMYHEQMEACRSRMEQLEEEIHHSFIERDDAENKVRNLINKYEELIEEREVNKEILAKKDIEIELLNASLSNLNMKASEYENTVFILHEEKQECFSKISVLETTISELSMKTQEKEMMESMLDEELNHRTDEVKKLEENIQEYEKKLQEVFQQRNKVVADLEAEKKITKTLAERIDTLEMEIKEKEVVQQFLEKEIISREAEVSESSSKVKALEEDLDTARQVALDLQQEAETKLAEVIHLKATISARDYDCEAKEDILSSLRDELNQKLDETSTLQEKVQSHLSTKEQLENALASTKEKLHLLDNELASVKAALTSREESLASVESKMSQLTDNNNQLEEKVVELMGEISDREAEHIVKIKTMESDLQDLGVKYSESLLEHEATRRVLTQTLEQFEREKLLHMASERDLENLKEEMNKLKEEKESANKNMKDLVQKYTSLEDALACEEAENRDLEERLEREADLAKETAAVTEKEMSTLKTSIDGFCTQITQLKIDMRKKSKAVEEMQLCIDTLREEKLHLTTLRDNLEVTLESKENIISQLHLQASTLEREMEEERLTLRSRIADLENHLKETQSEQEETTRKIKAMEEKFSSLEEENLHLNKSYEKQLEEKTISETQANSKLEDLKNQYEGYEDQVKNLQTSLLEKTSEVEILQGKCTAANNALESCQEEMKVLETSVKRFKREMDAMNKTLASKDTTLDSLNNSLATKSEEVQSLYKTLEEKQSSLLACECRLQQLEENEEMVNKEKDQLSISLASLRDELDAVKSQYSRLETTYSEEKAVEISRVKCVMEVDIDDLKNLNTTLQEELESWKAKFQHLEKMIEPFREQLDSYEVEKASLLSRSSAAKEEVDKLSKQYATLLGHQNHKQKIQHVLKLKTENNDLREDVHKLRQETERQRKTIRRFEDKMRMLSGSSSRLNETTRSVNDKENSFYSGMGSQTLASTPLKPSNKPQRI